MSRLTVAALYKFVKLTDFEALQAPLLEVCERNDVFGTLLLAHEGINGTIAGPQAGIDAVLGWLRAKDVFADLEVKFSHAETPPFHRMKVRLKKEIVTMGVEDIDPNRVVGTYVDPLDWNALIADPETLVIDTRNDYETGIGTFERAVDPETKSFRDFPTWANDLRDRVHKNPPKNIAMYCTGGIRCEKSTAYMKALGFENVFHLKGGILKYLETVPEEDSLWKGECFVFDQRVSVGHGLEVGDYDQCFACRRPITEADKDRPEYVKGVSCHQCIHEYDPDDRARFAERQKQIELARARGETHIGVKTE